MSHAPAARPGGLRPFCAMYCVRFCGERASHRFLPKHTQREETLDPTRALPWSGRGQAAIYSLVNTSVRIIILFFYMGVMTMRTVPQHHLALCFPVLPWRGLTALALRRSDQAKPSPLLSAVPFASMCERAFEVKSVPLVGAT